MIKNGPDKMKEVIPKVMPEMMKHCMGTMCADEMIGTMHEVMPKMMENCMANMTQIEKNKMFEFCHSMLDKMEKKHKQKY
jgi:hypothetical protein